MSLGLWQLLHFIYLRTWCRLHSSANTQQFQYSGAGRVVAGSEFDATAGLTRQVLGYYLDESACKVPVTCGRPRILSDAGVRRRCKRQEG